MHVLFPSNVIMQAIMPSHHHYNVNKLRDPFLPLLSLPPKLFATPPLLGSALPAFAVLLPF